MPALPKEPQWLRANVSGRPTKVDRKEQAIRGMVVALSGPFKSAGRGEFDLDALKEIVRLTKAAPNGLKSRFAHPTLSDDGIGKFLGRVRDPWIEKIGPRESSGELKTDEVSAVRADLHLDPTSRNTPNGDLGGYILDLAESDPDALSSSLVLTREEEYRIDNKGRPLKDEEGEPLPPLWRPIRLHASDLVSEGDAVDGLLGAQNGLSIDGLPDEVVRKAAALLDQQFGGASAEVVRARCMEWLDRYLAIRPGDGASSETIRRSALGRAARIRGG
jgi:hypothetical protein